MKDILRDVVWVSLLGMLIAVVGCSSNGEQTGAPDVLPEALAASMRDAAEFQLLSIDPTPLDMRGEDRNDADDVLFERWEVLGRATIESTETRAALLQALAIGVDEGERDGSVAGCFNPRHGFVVRNDDVTHTLIICLECRQVQWFVDGAMQQGMLVSESPAKVLNAALKDAGVPLATN